MNLFLWNMNLFLSLWSMEAKRINAELESKALLQIAINSWIFTSINFLIKLKKNTYEILKSYICHQKKHNWFNKYSFQKIQSVSLLHLNFCLIISCYYGWQIVNYLWLEEFKTADKYQLFLTTEKKKNPILLSFVIFQPTLKFHSAKTIFFSKELLKVPFPVF